MFISLKTSWVIGLSFRLFLWLFVDWNQNGKGLVLAAVIDVTVVLVFMSDFKMTDTWKGIESLLCYLVGKGYKVIELRSVI